MVVVKRPVTVDNVYGGKTTTWVDHSTFTGVIDMLSGSEVIATDKLGRASSHILIIFYIADVKRDDRIIDNLEQYRVTYVDNPMGLNRQLEISLLWEKTIEPDETL